LFLHDVASIKNNAYGNILSCDRPLGHITRLARPSVRLSVCLSSTSYQLEN